MRFLITILTSYNEYILFTSYETIINQLNIPDNISYKIIIVVNSLDTSYYTAVCNTFKNINVEIVETLSNGKPGMGHNSVIDIFKNNTDCDYLIPIDGDDFLYPYALYQLSKILIYQPTVVVGSNEDYISNYKNIYNDNSYYLNNNYFIFTQPNIPIKRTFSLLENGTAFRLILLHKSIFTYNINKLYCENSQVFDDYLLYLIVLNLYYTTNCNIYYITLKNIYFYYKAHISSTCYLNSSNCNDDINGMIKKFPHLNNIENNNILIKLPILYIIDPDNKIIPFENINNSITFKDIDYTTSNTYKINFNFALDLSTKLYNNTLDYIENKLKYINKYNVVEKKKLYLTVENLILNNNIENKIIEYFLIISNNLNYIKVDIADIILNTNYLSTNYIEEYNNNNYVSSYLILSKLSKTKLTKSIYYYYYESIMKLTNNTELLDININTTTNSITLNNKKIIILLDCMDIDYTLYTPFTKGLGGTQTAYINLAIELVDKYNVIILNKKQDNLILNQHNIHIIKYDNYENMVKMINNINPDYIIYNFISVGELLKKNTNAKLFMYEHLTVYSNFKLKINSDYYNYYDKIIFVSENQYYDYKLYLNININKVIILHNTLSPLFYFNNNILSKKKLNIIYISNPQRGLECFLHIFPTLLNMYPTLTLDIYSSLNMYDIEDNSNLKNMYNNLKSMNNVNYNKSISQYELVEKLNSSLLFIYPTFVVESFCNSMIEAMSCGCYVIATNLGALKSVAEPYGDFVDINIIDKTNHPYYDSINNIYINEIINKAKNIIDLYLNNSVELNNYLNEQKYYIKKKYENNAHELFRNIDF